MSKLNPLSYISRQMADPRRHHIKYGSSGRDALPAHFCQPVIAVRACRARKRYGALGLKAVDEARKRRD